MPRCAQSFRIFSVPVMRINDFFDQCSSCVKYLVVGLSIDSALTFRYHVGITNVCRFAFMFFSAMYLNVITSMIPLQLRLSTRTSIFVSTTALASLTRVLPWQSNAFKRLKTTAVVSLSVSLVVNPYITGSSRLAVASCSKAYWPQSLLPGSQVYVRWRSSIFKELVLDCSLGLIITFCAFLLGL